MFLSVTIIRSLYLGLAKVTVVKLFGKNTSLCACSGVVAYYEYVKYTLVCMQCVVQDETHSALHTAYTPI